jgi:chemotaxis protein methyltransferase WspC
MRPEPTPVAPEPAAADPPRAATATLEEIRAFADQGHFAEAASHCEDHLRVAGPSADAFCLLGVVREAAGDADAAAACYRKALYLEPEHAEAVTHLALLVERQGHAVEAKVLWSRARRLTAGAAR